MIVLIAMGLTLRISRPTTFYRDRTNDLFFAAVAAETEGVVLTGGSYQLVQLYTHRPVLIDGGGLDTVTYAPETGPAMQTSPTNSPLRAATSARRAPSA